MAHDTLHPSRARGARPGRTAGAWIDGVLRDVRSGTREPFAVSVRGDLVMVGPVPAGEAGAPGEQPGTVGLLPPRAVPGCLCLDLQGDERRTCVMLSDGPAFLGEFTLGPDDREDLVSLVIAAVEGRARIEYSVFRRRPRGSTRIPTRPRPTRSRSTRPRWTRPRPTGPRSTGPCSTGPRSTRPRPSAGGASRAPSASSACTGRTPAAGCRCFRCPSNSPARRGCSHGVRPGCSAACGRIARPEPGSADLASDRLPGLRRSAGVRPAFGRPCPLSRAAVPTDWDRRVAWWTAGQGLPGRGQRCVA